VPKLVRVDPGADLRKRSRDGARLGERRVGLARGFSELSGGASGGWRRDRMGRPPTGKRFLPPGLIVARGGEREARVDFLVTRADHRRQRSSSRGDRDPGSGGYGTVVGATILPPAGIAPVLKRGHLIGPALGQGGHLLASVWADLATGETRRAGDQPRRRPRPAQAVVACWWWSKSVNHNGTLEKSILRSGRLRGSGTAVDGRGPAGGGGGGGADAPQEGRGADLVVPGRASEKEDGGPEWNGFRALTEASIPRSKRFGPNSGRLSGGLA